MILLVKHLFNHKIGIGVLVKAVYFWLRLGLGVFIRKILCKLIRVFEESVLVLVFEGRVIKFLKSGEVQVR